MSPFGLRKRLILSDNGLWSQRLTWGDFKPLELLVSDTFDK